MTLIRPAAPSEAAALSAIARASKAHWGYSEELLELWSDALAVTPDFIAEHTVFCAVDRGSVVGFAALCAITDGVELEHLWVVPERIGTGVGQALLCAAVVRARRAGATRMRIVSDPNAAGFYERHGAERVGVIEGRPPGRRLPEFLLALEPADGAGAEPQP